MTKLNWQKRPSVRRENKHFWVARTKLGMAWVCQNLFNNSWFIQLGIKTGESTFPTAELAMRETERLIN